MRFGIWNNLLHCVLSYFSAVCANNYSFFPFYSSYEISSCHNKNVLLDIKMHNNASAEWVLRNGLSAVIVNSSASLEHHLGLIYPTLGYYIHSSSALEMKVQTNITSHFRFNSVYNVIPDTSLGQTYFVSTIHNTSEKYTCAILAPFNNLLNIEITLPKELLHQVTINGTRMDDINTRRTVPNGQAVKLSSLSPIRHVLIQSTRNPFSVFCVEEHVRYQLKPSSHCGKSFNFLCPKNVPHVTHCHVFLTCITSGQNTLTLSNSTGFRKEVTQSGYFLSYDLVSGEDLDLRSKHEICVLLTKYSHEHDIVWTEVEMLSSLGTHFINSIDSKSTNSQSLSTLSIQTGKSNPLTEIPLGHTSSLRHTSLQLGMKYSSTQRAGFPIQTSSTESTTNTAGEKTWVSVSPLLSSIVSHTMSESPYQKTSMTFYKETSGPSEQTTNYRMSPSILMNLSSILGQSTSNVGSKLKIATNTQLTTVRHNESAISSNAPLFQSLKTSHFYTSTPSRRDDSTAKAECKCSPGEYCIELQRSTLNFSTLEEKMKHLHSVLMVNKSRLNSFLRQKRCAQDERPSARNLGYVGAIIISICFGSIVMCDLMAMFESRLKYTRN